MNRYCSRDERENTDQNVKSNFNDVYLTDAHSKERGLNISNDL